MATTISIPGGGSTPPLIFTVTGVSTTNYALAFAGNVASPSTINVLSSGPSPMFSRLDDGGPVLNEILPGSSNPSGAYTLTAGGEYTVVDVGTPVSLTGSSDGGDTVLGGGDLTYTGTGGSNQVTFIDGANSYVGSDVGGDTVTGGSGYDSITTGAASTTVFSGSGTDVITLNDTVGGDIAYLGDGHSTVNADGMNDTVVAATNGQTIFGGATGTVYVNIMDNVTASGAAGDDIVAGAATVNVFDSVGGNSIFGGAGSLTFVGEPGMQAGDSILAGSGTTNIFSSDSDDLTFASTAGGSAINVVAGTGNETLNGANAGDFNLFASSDTSSSISLQVVGGSGSDYFSTGAGTENYVAGTGTDVFGLNTVDGGGANITIYDFSAADSVSLDSADQGAATSGVVTTDPTTGVSSYTITLSDDSTVTFVGITSLTGHVI